MNTFINVEQTLADLRAAVEHVKTHPWGQWNDYDTTTGCFCAFGSIRAVIGGLVIDPEVEGGIRNLDSVVKAIHVNGEGTPEYLQAKSMRDRASNASRAFYRIIGAEITCYNDTEKRTKGQIVTALETVIARLEEDPRRA